SPPAFAVTIAKVARWLRSSLSRACGASTSRSATLVRTATSPIRCEARMKIGRRQFVATGVAAAAAMPDISKARADFPWASKETYLNTATEHPLSVQTATAMREYLDALVNGPDSARDKFENGRLMTSVKEMFARLIRAKPNEI